MQMLLEGLGPDVAKTERSITEQNSSLLALMELEAQVSEQCAKETREAVASGAGVFNKQCKPQTSELLVCANCGSHVTVHRFAPHLEKCMLGKGRASARAARDSMQRQSAAENGGWT